ncbi:lipocalin family protein [Mycolicibacterium sp. BiH015]|uniref:lipocalin family protein n=1 Tax=Mycolicibacterium sp. BiH015 TaxID=3018808 RepID=UPI0022E42241|nr:lipocalin family protein [Mycolicibacterium sp. BiH015]MDA2891461.1 lipocalin family protein [Mycolicibacterium sp. BiH015]
MTSRHWALWLGTFGAGACIAFGAGQGVAAADSDTPDGGAESSSQAAGTTTDHDDESSSLSSPESENDRRGTTKRDRADAADSDSPEDVAREQDSPSEPDAESAEADSPAETQADTEPPTTDSETDNAKAVEDTSEPVDEATTESATAPAQAIPAGVTGVTTGQAALTIPVGDKGYKTRASWYLPTQSDGSVAATGVIWLQHGFLGNRSSMSKLAQTLSLQTNSIVVTPFISSFPLRCSSCWINGVPMQQAVASMFLGERSSLTSSAALAGYSGVLPEDFVMSGQSAGGGFATAVGGYYVDDAPGSDALRGVVMFDGFALDGVVPSALQKLDDPFVPVYQIAAPPQPFNSGGSTTQELVAARPGQFVGVTLAGGSHADSLIGGNAIFDFFAQLVTGISPRGNTQAVYTLATGWINDLYQGLGPDDGTGIYGAPDQYLVLGEAAGVVLAPPPVVDLDRYLGTWFEVGSVKQFFSIGLVNTTAVYSLNPDGSIKVENSGNYFVNNGPKSTIVGSALPIDEANNKLNVAFFGSASTRPPGNYWIVDLDPDYGWAVVTDPTGFSGFLLSRDPIVSDEFYQELLDRASVYGVKNRITPTRQPAATSTST